jgi:adenylate cyclase
VSHFALIVPFALAGAWPLVWFNLGSVAIWFVVGALHRRRMTYAAVNLGLAEVVAHAAFATYVIGWASGFHFAIPVVAGLYLGFHYNRGTWQWVGPFIATFVWGISFVLLADRTPQVSLPAGVLAAFGFSTAVLLFILVSLAVLVLAKSADTAEAALAREHLRSERLVHNMLPLEIANRLKDGEGNIADRIEEASVLFADLVGFTTLSAQVRPSELVVILSDLFSRFDALVEKHQLEKIKTIGDAYMVASGVPRPRSDHAEALADFALDLVQELEALAPLHGAKLKMRIGISSGAVVAGVIGRSKLAYDMWGDTVNTAARMESHGDAGRIHVTRAVRDRLGPRFELEPRGVIDVKGKGPMETFFLNGRGENVRAN